jgi:hypothetical protein
MAKKAMHLDCEVFTLCHAEEALCGTWTWFSGSGKPLLKMTSKPEEVTCKRCLRTGAKMSRILYGLKSAEQKIKVGRSRGRRVEQ